MIELSSPRLSLVVSPEHGGAITSFISRRTNDEWVYFDRLRRPQKASLKNYDDVWCGGFEELFPNDAEGDVQGRFLEDHGELWKQSWEVKYQSDHTVEMELHCRTVPAIVQKRITIKPESHSAIIDYTLQNKSNETYPYLFKLHPAMRIDAGDEILLSDGEVIPVDMTFSKIIGQAGPFHWPIVSAQNGENANIAIIPEREKKLQEFIYVKSMSEAWCGLKRKRTGEKFILSYALEDFPYCWFFMAFGGWRDYYTLVMEPCTNFPKDINVAIANGTCAIMKPLEKRNYSISISLS